MDISTMLLFRLTARMWMNTEALLGGNEMYRFNPTAKGTLLLHATEHVDVL